MGLKEKLAINDILKNMDKGTRLFRINSGQGWTGEIVQHNGEILILANPRPLHAAPSGWPDLCGWQTIVITPDMVGKKLAVFKGIEVKTGKQTLRKKQESLRDIIIEMGGIFEVHKDSK